MSAEPLWITEADVVALMDLPQAIDALEFGLAQQAEGAARNMGKTHVGWGHGDTLHAIGATFEGAGIVGTKTWAHTEGGATPLLILWDAHAGRLLAVLEAFALGQMRTGAMSGVATRWMAAEGADEFALIGTGKQAMAQLAAVAAVRPLKRVRVFAPDPDRRARFVDAVAETGFSVAVAAAPSVAAATEGAAIVTLVTRARKAFFTAAMAARGAHINAIGAITPEREEFTPDIFARAGLVAADDPATARKLSKEFREFYSESTAAWEAVTPICMLVGGAGRPAHCDLSVFKAMGMGISDLSLAIRIYRRALADGRGRVMEIPRKAAPRLFART